MQCMHLVHRFKSPFMTGGIVFCITLLWLCVRIIFNTEAAFLKEQTPYVRWLPCNDQIDWVTRMCYLELYCHRCKRKPPFLCLLWAIGYERGILQDWPRVSSLPRYFLLLPAVLFPRPPPVWLKNLFFFENLHHLFSCLLYFILI